MRTPSVLFAIGFASTLVWMPGRWLGTRARFIAAVADLTNLALVDKGRMIEIEAVYTAMTGFAVLAWLNRWSNGGGAWGRWLSAAVFLTMAMMTKGPASLLAFYVVGCERRFRDLLSWPHAVALAMLGGVGGRRGK